MSDPVLTVLSLGAGVQSTTVLLRCLLGDAGFPRLDHVIFADVLGHEPQAVYAHLTQLQAVCANAGVPLHIVRRTEAELHAKDWRFAAQIPSYVRHEDGTVGIGRRQCTQEFKITPIRAKVRELLGVPAGQAVRLPAGSVVQVMGISYDEAHRMKDPDVRWVRHAYPLVDMRLKRAECEAWLRAHWYGVVPRSACVMCPFKSDAEWRRLRDEDADGWDRAVAFDASLRESLRTKGLALPAYVHRSVTPLSEVDLSTLEDHGQQRLSWGDECTGLCGV